MEGMEAMEAMEVTESVTVSLWIKGRLIRKILARLLFCFKGVTVAEEATVMDMEEDTAEDIGVEVTQMCPGTYSKTMK